MSCCKAILGMKITVHCQPLCLMSHLCGEEGDRHVLGVPMAGDNPAEAEQANRGSRFVKDGSAAHGDGAAP